MNRISPVATITIAAILAVSLAVLSTLLALSGPWLGVSFDRSYQGNGIRVAEINDHSPVADKLHQGDIISAVSTPAYGRVELSSLATLEEPDQLDSYARYNAFFVLQQALWQAVSSTTFVATLSDGRSIELAAGNFPPVSILPFSYWWLLLFGGASFLLGVSAWIMRPGESVTRILAVSGLGFMVGAYSCAIYTARELAIPGDLFRTLAATNHLGIMVFAYAAILFFWYYPRKLGTGNAAWIYVAGVPLLWLNETLQWLSWPAHAFYAHFLVAYFLLFRFAYLQWRMSQGAPLERAMLKWLLATMVLNLGITLVLFYGPVILTGKPIASTVLTFCSVFLFYLGLVVGNIRYHQFDMEHWWIRAWQWLVFIFIALIADALFFYFWHVTVAASLGLSIGVGVIYLLVRRWFWGKFSGNNNSALDRALPHLIETLVSQQYKLPLDMQWKQIVVRVFNPLSVTTISGMPDNVSLSRNGLALRLPSLDGSATMEAFCCDRGNRLFTHADIHLATRLLELMRYSNDVFAAHAQGVLDERRRIQRDLHDDVASRLLSLIHQTRDPEIGKVAQSALRGLRDVIFRLDAEEATLADVMSDIEASAREQLAGLCVHFEWRSTVKWPTVMLSSGQHINLRRIAREAIANALKHAHPERIYMEAVLIQELLSLSISNDGEFSDPADWIANRGLNNIKARVAEMGGSHKWLIEQTGPSERYCRLVVNVPLILGGQLEQHSAY
jgi:signal transduction histidine kinase